MGSSTLRTAIDPRPDWAHGESIVWNLSKSNVRILLSHLSKLQGLTLNALVTRVNISETQIQKNDYGVTRAITSKVFSMKIHQNLNRMHICKPNRPPPPPYDG